jgi:type IV pilus assembly protein PilQ
MPHRRASSRHSLSSVCRHASVVAFCVLLLGCASAPPKRRPVSELIEEARAASRQALEVPFRELSVEQASAHMPLPPNGPAAVAERLPPVYDGPQVSESFVETDVREALQILASQAKISIIIDEQVRGLTSAVIENEPFEAALEMVLLPLGYVHRKIDGQYLVGLQDPESSLFPRIAERYDYFPTHLAPLELLNLLPENLKRFVRTSDKRNVIIVEAPRAIAERILLDLQRSDKYVEQVVLEAMVCVISPERSLQLGLNLEQGVLLNGTDSAVNLALSSLSVAAQYGPPQLAGMRNFTFTSALLKALAREGYVSIRAAPRVMAKDGETAKISIAKETFFSVQPGTAQLLFRQDIQKVEAGITLDIRPVIRGDHVTVHIEQAEVSEGINSPLVAEDRSNAFPIINRRRVSTTVHVQDGETITIGGLVQRQEIERINKLPFLGDIPYVGALFRQVDRREEENEVIIFICPRIVREGVEWKES